MHEIQAPEPLRFGGRSVFLGGTITGSADWQAEVVASLDDLPVVVLNPRRAEWAPDSIEERAQIEWEFQALAMADVRTFWFAKETVAPITLYELGRWAAISSRLLVGVHPDYPRRLDVEIQLSLARPYMRPIVYSLEDHIQQVRWFFSAGDQRCIQ